MARFPLVPALVAALLIALPTTALAAGSPNSRRAAENALTRVKELKKGVGVRSGRELTPALAQLAARRGALDATGRKEAAAILARPTDGNADPYGDGYTVAEATPVCGVLFCIHYVTTTPDAPASTDTSPANGIPDYVDHMLAVFDDVHACENGSAVGACSDGLGLGLGWQEPVSDGTKGGDSNKFDVYIKNLFPQSIYGYAAPECPMPLTSNACPAFMVMDKDYSRFGPAVPGETADDAEAVTAAHEYNHVLQFGYDVIEDAWMFESTATYMEEKVYPSINDYLQYLPDWITHLSEPLTEFSPASPGDPNLKVYGSAVWNHWLDHRYGGDDVIQSAWAQSPATNSFAPDAYGKSIRDRGGAGFPDEFESFAAGVAEWRVPGSGFPDVYPDVADRPSLPLEGSATTITLDHTTFAFRDITPPSGAQTPVAVSATLPSGLKGAIALVGRTGGSNTAGEVTTKIASTVSGGRLTVVLPNAGSFGRITAVFVNADPSNVGYSSLIGDWVFTKDNQSFSGIRATTSAPPGVTTTPVSNVTTTGATLNGTVNPQGMATTYWFQYGTTTAYGAQVPLSAADAGSGTTDTPVSTAVSGLTAGTTYHYRIVAQGPGGTAFGNDQSFATLSPPAATTGAATGIGVESATLNATVDPRGSATTYVFEYGTTAAYGRRIPLTPGSAGSASQALAVATPVAGLKPGTLFHFRVVATNAAGSTPGADATFRTVRLRVLATLVKTTLGKALKRGLPVKARCNANCSVALQLLLPAKLAKRLHLKRVVATGKVKTGPRNRTATLRFSKKAKRVLARQLTVKLTVKLSATTRTGGKRVLTKVVKLR